MNKEILKKFEKWFGYEIEPIGNGIYTLCFGLDNDATGTIFFDNIFEQEIIKNEHTLFSLECEGTHICDIIKESKK